MKKSRCLTRKTLTNEHQQVREVRRYTIWPSPLPPPPSRRPMPPVQQKGHTTHRCTLRRRERCKCARVYVRRVQEECGNNSGAHPVAHIITITSNRLARSTPKYTYYTPRLSATTTYLVHRYDTHTHAVRPTTTTLQHSTTIETRRKAKNRKNLVPSIAPWLWWWWWSLKEGGTVCLGL